MNLSTQANKCEPLRTVAGVEVLQRLNAISGRAGDLLSQAEDVFRPILRPEDPTPCGAPPAERDYPPLFDAMRNELLHLDSTLDRLAAVIARADI